MLKSKEYEKLEQEVKKLKAKNKVLDSSKLLEDLISMQKSHLDKIGLGFQLGECLDQNDKDKSKEVKEETEKKSEDARKIWNQNTNARRLPVHQPNDQRYPSFNGYYFQCNKFGHKAANCRSIQCYSCKRFGHKANHCRNHVVSQNHNTVGANKMNYNFHGYYYTCNGYGHKANQSRYRYHPVNFARKFVSCFKCK